MELSKEQYMKLRHNDLRAKLYDFEYYIRDIVSKAYDAGYERAELDHTEKLIREAVDRIVKNKNGDE